jgi:hypothetical protein
MDCTTRTVQRAEREAVELGLVRVKRRWLKSNIYYVLCLEERLSTDPTQSCRIEQRDFIKENVANACSKTLSETRNPWRVAKVILSDICEVMPQLAEKNLGWFTLIARNCAWEVVQQALHDLRCRMLEADVGSGESIRSAGGWFTYRLRELGAPI